MSTHSHRAETLLDRAPVKDAQLFVTFYCKQAALIAATTAQTPKGLHPLTWHFITTLDLKAVQGGLQYTSTSPAGIEQYVWQSHPLAEDTLIVQLAMGTPGPVAEAWKTLRAAAEQAWSGQPELGGIWGYTMVYLAEMTQGEIPDVQIPTFTSQLVGLHSAGGREVRPLAAAALPSGRVWLLDIPTQGEDCAAALLYLALSHPLSNTQLVEQVITHPDALLLRADLITHKAHQVVRQYQGDGKPDRYNQKIDNVVKTSNALITYPVPPAPTRVKGGGWRDPYEGCDTQINLLSHEYQALLATFPSIDVLRIQLYQQRANYALCNPILVRAQVGTGIYEYHRTYIETRAEEFELLVAKGRTALEAGRTVLDFVQVQRNLAQARWQQQQANQQQWIQGALAIIGVALAIPQIVDREAALDILNLLGWHLPSGQPVFFPVLAVQLIIMGVIIILIRLLLTATARHQPRKPHQD